MKRISEGLIWAIFLLLAGAFLLLKNLGVFGAWGEVVWGGIYALVGLGFLVWFVLGVQRWWRAIPGFTLLSTGALVLLQWRGVDLGDWGASLILFGVALGFWAILLVHTANWWAVIPAGVLTVLGVLTGLQMQPGNPGWLAIFLVGLGLVFVLLYVLRVGQEDTRWAGIPAGALLLLGIVTGISATQTLPIIATWWPLALLLASAGVLAGYLIQRNRRAVVLPSPDYGATQPAPGTSVSDKLPAAVELPRATKTRTTAPGPARTEAASGESEPAVDIYKLLSQQPPETGSESGAAGKPADAEQSGTR